MKAIQVYEGDGVDRQQPPPSTMEAGWYIIDPSDNEWCNAELQWYDMAKPFSKPFPSKKAARKGIAENPALGWNFSPECWKVVYRS